MAEPISVDGVEHFHDIVSKDQATVVLFFAPWCNFCAAMCPIYDGVATSAVFQQVQFCKVDIDGQKEIRDENKIMNVPQVSVYRNGNVLVSRKGVVQEQQLKEWINSAISPDAGQTVLNSEDARGPCCKDGIACPCNHLKSPANEHNVPDTTTTCTGRFEDRRRRPSFFPRSKVTFSDLEPNCVFQPTVEDLGIQIGRANDGASYFAIILWNSPYDDPGRICFTVDFMPDPVEKARFESAMFWVTFGRTSTSDDGHHPPLNIQDICPTDEMDQHSTITWRSELDKAPPAAEPLDDSSSIYSPDAPPTPTAFSSTEIRGQGLRSPTASWNFTESKNDVARRGLDAHYDLFISLQSSDKVWMKFWGKAVLIRGPDSGLGITKRAMLKIGSMEAPFERILDLSVALKEGGAQ